MEDLKLFDLQQVATTTNGSTKIDDKIKVKYSHKIFSSKTNIYQPFWAAIVILSGFFSLISSFLLGHLLLFHIYLCKLKPKKGT